MCTTKTRTSSQQSATVENSLAMFVLSVRIVYGHLPGPVLSPTVQANKCWDEY